MSEKTFMEELQEIAMKEIQESLKKSKPLIDRILSLVPVEERPQIEKTIKEKFEGNLLRLLSNQEIDLWILEQNLEKTKR